MKDEKARRTRPDQAPEIPMAPMIDCVFLMLVYFMVTSSLERAEADLAFYPQGSGVIEDPLPAVDEQVLHLDAEGHVEWNGSMFAVLEVRENIQLRNRLEVFQKTCLQAGSEPSIRLCPDPLTPHQAVVAVLDYLNQSGIERICFPSSTLRARAE